MEARKTIAADQLNDALVGLTQASDALYCFLNMLGQAGQDATVDAVGLRSLLLPVGVQVSSSLDSLMAGVCHGQR